MLRFKDAILLTALVLFAGCGIEAKREAPLPPVDFPEFEVNSSTIPYDDAKFRPVLEKSKLHYPANSAAVEYGEFAGYITPYFYVGKEGYLTFCGDKNETHGIFRNELREGPEEWHVSSPTPIAMRGEAKCYRNNEITTYTWMQIHASHPFSYPLLRLVWLKTKNGVKDHLWAVIMESLDIEAPRVFYDMGPRPEDFFPFSVTVQANNMSVEVNGVVRDFNVTFWQEKSSYFKVGFYITKHDELGYGCVQFQSLEY